MKRPSDLFERWAVANQYAIAPAVSPTDIRVYADNRTQQAFDAWSAGYAEAMTRNVDASYVVGEQSARFLLSG